MERLQSTSTRIGVVYHGAVHSKHAIIGLCDQSM